MFDFLRIVIFTFYKVLNELRDPLAILITVLMVALASLQIFRRYRRESQKERAEHEQRIQSAVAPETIDNLDQLLVQNFLVLNTYYSENLSQSRISSLASISIAVLGFIVIVSGVLIALLGKQVLLGTVSSAAGIVSEAAAVLFFRQNRTFQDQMERSLKKLVSTQYLMTSIALAREMPEETRIQEVREINKHLRELMNILHIENQPSRSTMSKSG